VGACSTSFFQSTKTQSATTGNESNKAITFTEMGFSGGPTVKDVKKATIAKSFDEQALMAKAKLALSERIDYPTFMKEIALAGCEQF